MRRKNGECCSLTRCRLRRAPTEGRPRLVGGRNRTFTMESEGEAPDQSRVFDMTTPKDICPLCNRPVDEHLQRHGAICGGTETATEWESPGTIFPRRHLKNKMVYVQCCNRNAPLLDTVGRFETAFGGYVAEWYFKCAADKGCSINPGYKRTAHLRYFD